MKTKYFAAAFAAVQLAFCAAAAAAAPGLMSYQATLRKSGSLYNGTASMEFRIVNADASVTYWTSGSTVVTVTAGLFRYPLGTPNEAQFSAIDWGSVTPYVQMKVDGGWMQPEPLYSSAYALHAAAAEGAAGSFAVRDGGIVISTTSGSRGITFQDGTVQYSAAGWNKSGSDIYAAYGGNAGIGVTAPEARLDLQAPAGGFSQIWRDASGVVKASMTADGMLYADGSLMRNMPTGADGLGNHTANKDLNMSGYNLVNVSSISAFSTAITIGSQVWVPNSRFGIGTNAPSAQLQISTSAGSAGDMVVISTGISKVIRLTGAGAVYATKFYGDGSGLTGVAGSGGADNLGNHTLTQNLVTGSYWLSNDGSASGLNFDSSGNAGLGQAAGGARLDVRGAANNLIQAWRNNSGVMQASMTVLGVLYADGSGLRNIPAGGTAAKDLNMAGYQVTGVSTATVGYLNSSGAGVVFSTNALVLGGSLGVNTASPQEKLHVAGNILSTALSGSANRCVYADSAGVLHAKTSDCGLASPTGDDLGTHVMTQNLNTNGNWVSGDGTSKGLTVGAGGNVGVGMTGAATRLDVTSGSDGYAQFWRDSGGVIVASMTSGGFLYADASKMRNLPSGASDNLGNHTATQDLNMAAHNIVSASSVTASYLGVSGTMANTALSGSGNRCVYVAADGTLHAKGSDCGTASGGDDLGSHTATQNLNMAGYSVTGAASVAAAAVSVNSLGSTGAGVAVSTDMFVTGGSLGINTSSPQEKLHVVGNILSSGLSGASNRCVYADSNGVLHAKTSDCGTASGGDDLGSHVMTQNLNTNGSWLSGDGGNKGIRIDSGGNVTVTDTSYTAAAKLDVRGAVGNYAQVWRNFSGVSQASMSATGVLYADGSGLRNLPSMADNMGNEVMTKNLSTAFYWISADGDSEGLFIDANGNVGVGQGTPSTRLDVTPMAADANSQVWRNSSGVVVASMTSAGLLYADGSRLRGLPAGADSLGSHIATTTLQMGGFPIVNAAGITASGLTAASSVTVTGASGLSAVKIRLGGVELSTATAAEYGGVYISTHVLLASGGRYYGDGSQLASLSASNMTAGTLADARLSSNVALQDRVNTFSSSVTVSDALGVSAARHQFAANVELSSAAAARYGGVQVSTHVYLPAGARYYGDGTPLTGVTDAGALRRAGDTMTGQLTLSGSTLTVGGNSFSVTGAAFMVESSGEVGIGTLSPGARLEVNDADANTATSGLKFTNFACSGTNKLTTDASGNVICAADQTGSGTGNVVDTLAETLGAGPDAAGAGMTGLGNVSIGGYSAGAVLDVQASGSYAQVWRNSSGVVVASMSATGVIYADGSGVRGLSAGGSNVVDTLAATLGSGSDAGGQSISGLNGLTASGQITSYSSVTVGGALGVEAARLKMAPNVEISSAAAAQKGGLYISSNVYLASGAKYYGDGSQLSNIPGGVGMANPATADFDVNGHSIVNISSITPSTMLYVNGSLRNTALAGSGNRCVHADASGTLSATSSDCGTGGGGGTESCTNPNNASDVMVAVGDFCVDKYESTVWSAVSGPGSTEYTNTFPCANDGGDCGAGGSHPIYALSLSGYTPANKITWFQANAACVNSGKHLITNAEWQSAVTGTPTASCNTSGGSPTQTGAGGSCVSLSGAENMVGSLWEMVAEWGVYSPNGNSDTWNTSLGAGAFSDDRAGGASGSPVSMMIRGGAYSESASGPLAFHTGLSPADSDSIVGFRCAMRLR